MGRLYLELHRRYYMYCCTFRFSHLNSSMDGRQRFHTFQFSFVGTFDMCSCPVTSIPHENAHQVLLLKQNKSVITFRRMFRGEFNQDPPHDSNFILCCWSFCAFLFLTRHNCFLKLMTPSFDAAVPNVCSEAPQGICNQFLGNP